MYYKDKTKTAMYQPISGKANIVDDGPVNRGISGQCLFTGHVL